MPLQFMHYLCLTLSYWSFVAVHANCTKSLLSCEEFQMRCSGLHHFNPIVFRTQSTFWLRIFVH